MDMLRLHGIGGAPIRSTSLVTITPGTQDIAKAGGNYTKGLKIVGEPNLVPENLIAGKNYFGIQGKATIESLGGKHYLKGSTTTNQFSAISIENIGFKPAVIVFLIEKYNYVASLNSYTSNNYTIAFRDNSVSGMCLDNTTFPNALVEYEIYG